MKTRCGFVGLIGAPNAGKSTLTNTLVGEKVSIVTHKVQTTRTQIRGIAMIDQTQAVLIDTPGIFGAKKQFDKSMVKAAFAAFEEADVLFHIVDAVRGMTEQDKLIGERLGDFKGQVCLILNKVDLIKDKKALLPIIQQFNEAYDYADTFLISATKSDGVDSLKSFIINALPAGPWHFDEDQLSDMPMQLTAAEVIREKILLNTHQEIPYGVMVMPEGWEVFKKGDIKISQVVYVARDTHKKIVLGKGGATIKRIREQAQHDLADMLGVPVHLFLQVKVDEKWQSKPQYYTSMGLDFAG